MFGVSRMEGNTEHRPFLKKILLPISKPRMWLLISEVELCIRPPVKENPGKNVSKYF
jgi:hypothetical protein